MSGLAVHGNEERLAQLIDKLLSNAHEHLAEGGEIRVELSRADDGAMELVVENDGDPLPADKKQIFEAFVSSHKTTENLGLGLFVAQSIALNHGGRITAEDSPGAEGARFVVRLPAFEERSFEREEERIAGGTRSAIPALSRSTAAVVVAARAGGAAGGAGSIGGASGTGSRCRIGMCSDSEVLRHLCKDH